MKKIRLIEIILLSLALLLFSGIAIFDLNLQTIYSAFASLLSIYFISFRFMTRKKLKEEPVGFFIASSISISYLLSLSAVLFYVEDIVLNIGLLIFQLVNIFLVVYFTKKKYSLLYLHLVAILFIVPIFFMLSIF